MSDTANADVEAARLDRLRELQRRGPLERVELAEVYGQVWDTAELTRDFDVEAFSAPFVVVRRKSDSQRGSLEFQHMPRFYYQFVPYRP